MIERTNTGAAIEARVEGAATDDAAVGYNRASGYADTRDIYWQLGWRGVLPLMRGTKGPPPIGFTGRGGVHPTYEDTMQWGEQYRDGGLCVRLDDLTVGLDVDAYGDKAGAATLAEGEKRWGPLPPTARSTSREDNVSGIKLFRVPAGTVLVGVIKFPELGIGDIDVIQHHHRYAVCWPSIHPEGRPYRWIAETDGAVMTTPPSPEDLPELPEPWLKALQADSQRDSTSRTRNGHNGSAVSSEPEYDVGDAVTGGEPSKKVAQRLGKALYDLAQGPSRHDTMVGHVMALLRYGHNGEPGVEFALATLCREFVNAVGPDRPGGESEAEAEFMRMVTNAGHLLDEPAAPTYPVGEQDHENGGTAPLMPGDELLNMVLAALNRYVKFPDEQSAVGVALWIAATHAIECWNAAPRLVLNSPQKRCGKTRALDVIGGMSHDPLITVNAAPAAVFRSLNRDRPPTLIIDEADAIFGTRRAAEQNEELRALLNAGHQRNRPALRCVGPLHEPTEFPTFAMVALAGIGSMPDTITDRAVNIAMRRRTSGEAVAQFRSRRDEPGLHSLRDQLVVCPVFS